MCRHVLDGGFSVTVCDPDAVRTASLVAAGAKAAPAPADAAQDASIVCIVVRNDEQAKAVVSGPAGVLSSLPTGGLVLLHSTVAPTTVRLIASACAEAGVRFVDAAISGAATGAASGTLYVMCGGARDDIDDASVVMKCFAAHITRFGEVGAGMAAKLARNLAHYAVNAALDEAMVLAERANIDLSLFADLVRQSRLWPAVEVRLDRTTTAPVGRQDPSYDVRRAYADLARKDLEDAFVLAEECDATTPIARAAYATVDATLQIEPTTG
jgi:3-hydroxyisobutyrate dehydrogenase-like beta-hydroxyacid dehydrogenase